MAETNKTATIAQVLTVVKAIAEAQEQGVELMDGVMAEDIINYCDKTLAQMENKKAKAAERRATKAAESDELREQIFELLTTEPQTRDAITEALGDPEISVAKVGARLTQLVKEGRAEKSKVKVDKSEKTVYFLPATDAE